MIDINSFQEKIENNGLEITLCNAEVKDISTILELIDKVCYDFALRKIDQWRVKSVDNYQDYTKLYDYNYWLKALNDPHQIAVVAKDEQGQIVGVVLLKDSDVDNIWPEEKTKAGLNYYIHHLCTLPNDKRLYAGLGKKLIYYMFYIALLQNADYLRFDCKSTNSGLNDFYCRFNLFKFIKSGLLWGYYNYNLYESEINLIRLMLPDEKKIDFPTLLKVLEEKRETIS